jgi:DNA-binding GntR family transcriptional regulator
MAATAASAEADAHERLRRAILDGELEPGRAYSQGEVSELLGIGRTPLREAVRRVQAEQLLTAEPNRRLQVAALDPGDLAELYAMRMMLEPLGVRLTVPRLGEGDIAAIARTLEAHVEACERASLEEARDLHREFHLALFSRCGERLFGEISDLWDHAQRYRRLYLRERADEIGLLHLARRDHEAILAAAEAGDARGCAILSARHLSHVALTLFAHIDAPEEPTEVRVALELAGLVLDGERSSGQDR